MKPLIIHNSKALHTKVDKTLKEEIQAFIYSQLGLNDKASQTKTEQISKEVISSSNYLKPHSNDKVSETKTKEISKEEIKNSSHSQPDLNDKASETNIKKISNKERNSSNDLKPDLNDKVSETKIDPTSKKEIDASNNTQFNSNDKVSETKVEQISKPEIETFNLLQPDLNNKVSETKIDNDETNDNKTYQQKIFVIDESLFGILKQQNRLFDSLSSHFRYNAQFFENKFEEMESKNINTSTSFMSVLNSAFKDFREQFDSNNEFNPEEDIVESYIFTSFTRDFEDVVCDVLTEIVNASEKQQKNKKGNKKRKWLVKNEKALKHLGNYSKSVFTVFGCISSFIESFAPESNPTSINVEKHIENWNQNVNDLKEEIQNAVKSLNSAKEIFSTQDMSEQFSKLLNQLNEVIKHFQSELCPKITVKRGSLKIGMKRLL